MVALLADTAQASDGSHGNGIVYLNVHEQATHEEAE